MPAPADKPGDLGTPVARWDAELRAYERAAEAWHNQSKRAVERYGLRSGPHGAAREGEDAEPQLNILWSNIQTILPSLFSRTPVPVVARRHDDDDPVGRLAAQMLERAVITDMEEDDIESVFSRVVLDALLVGRGAPWVRYDADIRSTETPLTIDEAGLLIDPAGAPVRFADAVMRGDRHVVRRDEVAAERAPVDYVYWRDFYHKPAKSWEELQRDGWIARRVNMTRDQGIARFGAAFRDVPLSGKPDGTPQETDDRTAPAAELAEVFEIWDAAAREVLWLCRGYKEDLLDRRPDPLGLRQFFPCPRPAYGTLLNDSLIPVPDYLQYEGLAVELDDITERIAVLTRALKVRGVYDASMENLAALLSDSADDNKMYPVANIAALIGKGATTSLQGVVQFLPIDMIAAVLGGLYDARQRVKNEMYEISGIADIIRGQVDPREKLGQSRIKGQFATLRLDMRKREIERVAREVVALKAEIIAEQFDPATIRAVSGFDFMPEIAQRMKTPQGQAQAAMMFEAAHELIRNDKMRGFRIDIETDSTVAIDEQQAKESRIEFLGAVGPFLERAVQTAQQVPALAPLMGEMLLFVIRGFRAGRPLEAAFAQAIEQMKQAAVQPPQQPQQPQQPPQPDPAAAAAQIALQAKQRSAAIDLEAKRAAAQIKMAEDQGRLALKGKELGLKAQEIAMRHQAAQDRQGDGV